MDRHKEPRNPLLLFLGFVGIITLSAYVNIVSPNNHMGIPGFFLLLIITTGLFGIYIFRCVRHAALLSLGVSIYLILRYIGLRQPFYAVLLVASIIAIEYLWKESP